MFPTVAIPAESIVSMFAVIVLPIATVFLSSVAVLAGLAWSAWKQREAAALPSSPYLDGMAPTRPMTTLDLELPAEAA